MERDRADSRRERLAQIRRKRLEAIEFDRKMERQPGITEAVINLSNKLWDNVAPMSEWEWDK